MADFSWLQMMASAMARQRMQAQPVPSLVGPFPQPQPRPPRPMEPFDRKSAMRKAQRRLERGWTGVSGLDDVERDFVVHAEEGGYEPMPDDKRQRLAAQVYDEHERQRMMQQLLAQQSQRRR